MTLINDKKLLFYAVASGHTPSKYGTITSIVLLLVVIVPGGIMPTATKYVSKLNRLFQRKRAALLADLRMTLGTASRTTIFRILKAIGYFTSYSHAGRYYTLGRIPNFDRRGLWTWKGIGFSSHGTLRATLVFLIEQSEAGQTHDELQRQVGLRVHDTLRSLAQAGTIARERFENLYVYWSAAPKKAAAQKAARQKLQVSARAAVLPPDPLLVIDILAEAIHHPRDEAAAITDRLHAAGRFVTCKQVEEVFHAYEVKKTAARSRCPK
jgi:hypothetical protein